MEVPGDYPPNKLRQAYGDSVLELLNAMVNQALRTNQYQWKKPVYRTDE